MIECEKYTALIPERTCVARQGILHRQYRPGAIGQAPRAQYAGCEGCLVGIELYRNFLKGEKGEKMDQVQEEPQRMRVCRTCKKSLPEDLGHFGFAARGKMGLTKDCLDCRGKKPVPEKPKKAVPAHRLEEKEANVRAGKYTITIDLTYHQDLFCRLQQDSVDQLRTMENQLLWMVLGQVRGEEF